MQALVRFWSAILKLVRNSSCRRHFFAFPISNVLLGHRDRGMPKLIFGLHDVSAGLCLVGPCFCSQVSHLEFSLRNTGGFSSPVKSPTKHRLRHRRSIFRNDQPRRADLMTSLPGHYSINQILQLTGYLDPPLGFRFSLGHPYLLTANVALIHQERVCNSLPR